MIHQTGDVINIRETDDLDFMERLYFGCHNREGTLHLVVGLGYYPNSNIMDAYVVVRHKNAQHNLRLSRYVNGDDTDMQVGPLSIKILEPHKRWSINLSDNKQGIKCDLEFEARTEVYLCKKVSVDTPDRGTVDHGHYYQMGRYKGSITIKDEEFNVDGFVGGRDRSWGRKGWTGEEHGLHYWCQVDFPDYTLSLVHIETLDGTVIWSEGGILYEDGRRINLTGSRHRIEFEPGLRAISNMELLLIDDRGEQRKLTARRISTPIYYEGGAYSRNGEDRGPLSIEGEVWDVSQPVDFDSPRFGITEPIAQFHLDGDPGLGLLEHSFSDRKDYQYKPSL